MSLKPAFLLFLIGICWVNFIFPQAAEEKTIAEKQETEKPAFQLGISFGFSFSNGNFSERDNNTVSLGFAEKNGNSFQLIELTYRIRPKLLAKVFYLQSKHDVAEEKLAESLADGNFTYQVSSTNYELKAFVGGIGFQLPGETASLSLLFLLAYGNTFVPAFEIEASDQNGNKRLLSKPPKDEAAFGFGVNPVLSIHLNQRLNFNTQLSYLIFESKFERIQVNQSAINNPFSDPVEKFGYEALNITFGFSYYL